MKCNKGRVSAFRPRGNAFIKGRCMSISYLSKPLQLLPQVACTASPCFPYSVPALLHPLPEIIVYYSSVSITKKSEKTYCSQDNPSHSPSTPIHPKLLSLSSPTLHPYFLLYQRRVPTTLPLLDSFGLCSLLFGLLLLEYRMRLGGVCF
jgi:hypothetical protein